MPVGAASTSGFDRHTMDKTVVLNIIVCSGNGNHNKQRTPNGANLVGDTDDIREGM